MAPQHDQSRERRNRSAHVTIGWGVGLTVLGAVLLAYAVNSYNNQPYIFEKPDIIETQGVMLAVGGIFAALGIITLLIGLMNRVAPARPRGARSLEGASGNLKAVRECPHCKESMRRDASVCPHCQRESQAWKLHEGRWWFTTTDGTQFYRDERKNEWIEYQAPGS